VAEARHGRRLDSDSRRDMLLDIAAEIALTDGPDAVSMEAVAEKAGVSRPLVYKHYASRDELLGAVYRRSARSLHRQLAAEVEAASSVEGMFRALVHGALSVAGERGHVFAVLRTGAWTRDVRREQRERDGRTSEAFTARVVAELGADPHRARPVVSLLLGTVDVVLSQWRLDPTPQRAERLEAAYMEIVGASLRALATGDETDGLKSDADW
jgi:AcrR family transcriptional regulator